MSQIKKIKGKILHGAFQETSLTAIGIEPDLIASDVAGKTSENISWTHRKGNDFDIYFVSNQSDTSLNLIVSLRVKGKLPELWDAVTGNIQNAETWRIEKGRTILPLILEPMGSVFIVLQQPTTKLTSEFNSLPLAISTISDLTGPWEVYFDASAGGPKNPVRFEQLSDWSKHEDSTIKYYSGTAVYRYMLHRRNVPDSKTSKVWLDLGKVSSIAEVFVNGIPCGIAWTNPYRISITKALKKGDNHIQILVVNTWNNRMIADSRVSPEKRITNYVFPFKWENKALISAGLLGPVTITESTAY